MEEKQSKENQEACEKKCVADFIRQTTRKPVGGAEMLRVCRDGCRLDETAGESERENK